MLRRALARLHQHYVDWRYGRIDPEAALGLRGEQAAARLLRQHKLVVISHQERDRSGEIDLIAIDRRTTTLVFVEVKTLATLKPGHPAERVDHAKQQQICRAALRYLKRKQLLGLPVRFDVVAVWWHSDGPLPDRIEHYRSAFEAPDQFQLY